MEIGNIDLDKHVLIVAEVGNNHEGDFALAERLIELAARAGAGAVKFQTIIPEKLVSPDQEARIAQLNKFRFTYAQFRQLKKKADQQNILFLSTPFDFESVEFLNEIVPAFKISSGDNDFFPLLEVVALTGKPAILSSGLATFDEIKTAKEFIENIWKQHGITQEMAILHCVSSYPTSPSDANLRCIETLKQLGVTVGYSDHTMGIEAAVLSVALGARIIEKHFTLDKNCSDFHDHKLSADPEDMASLVKKVREASVLLGNGKKAPAPGELAVLEKTRRSIVACRFLPKGHCITREDLGWTRPMKGLKPGQESLILHKTLKRDISAGAVILPEDVMDS